MVDKKISQEGFGDPFFSSKAKKVALEFLQDLGQVLQEIIAERVKMCSDYAFIFDTIRNQVNLLKKDFDKDIESNKNTLNTFEDRKTLTSTNQNCSLFLL